MTRRVPTVARVALVATAVPLAVIAVLPDVLRASWITAYGVAGGLLIVRRPGNSIGWLLALVALAFTGITDLTPAQLDAIRRGDADAGEAARIWIGAMSGAWAFLGYAILALVFPTGRLPDGRWRRPIMGGIAVAMLATAVTMVHPRISVTTDGGTTTAQVVNPLAVLPDSGLWKVMPDGDTGFLPVLVLLAIGVVSVVIRARGSTGIVRLQMRWLAAAMAALFLAIVAGAALILVVGSSAGSVPWLPASIAFLTIPAAVLVAVSRYRLLDIDRVVSRTIAWMLVTGVLAAVFLGAVALLQAVLVGVTQGSTVAVAASTLMAAALFQPVRRRLQAAVDRRFDRTTVDRDRMLEAYSARLRDEVDLATIQGEILASTDDIVRPSSAAVWLRARAMR